VHCYAEVVELMSGVWRVVSIGAGLSGRLLTLSHLLHGSAGNLERAAGIVQACRCTYDTHVL